MVIDRAVQGAFRRADQKWAARFPGNNPAWPVINVSRKMRIFLLLLMIQGFLSATSVIWRIWNARVMIGSEKHKPQGQHGRRRYGRAQHDPLGREARVESDAARKKRCRAQGSVQLFRPGHGVDRASVEGFRPAERTKERRAQPKRVEPLG